MLFLLLPLTFIVFPFTVAMSQSQHSDFVPSFYDGDIDNLGYLAPSSQDPTPSGSQLILEAIDTEFLRPINFPPIPSSLTRVGPNRRKDYVLYDNMTHNEWVEWWLQTEYGRKSKILWDSSRNASIWSNFDQVAHTKDGAPKVMCKRCLRILEHPHSSTPSQKGYHGTSTMLKHLKTAGCINSQKGGKGEITQFLRKAVCSYFLFIYLFLKLISSYK